ncbi:MAG: hypothetical protein ABIF19_05265 [Planctomycetota bacterium]
MNRRRTAIVAAVAFVCGAVSFFNGRSTALGEREMQYGRSQKWLSDASRPAIALEEKFSKELDGLVTNLVTKQTSLASALEDPCTPDEVVLEFAESVTAAHEHLMRRAGEHVVELRGKLPAGNRDYLMSLCAETLRGPISRLGEPAGRGYGYGRGAGRGRGGGGGYGMGMRAKDRLARRLRLDEEQISILQDKDPDFETDSARLRDALLAERTNLLVLFEDAQSTDEALLQQIDKLVEAHSQIERRITSHVLVLRPYLTVEQQKWLIGLCRRTQEGS